MPVVSDQAQRRDLPPTMGAVLFAFGVARVPTGGSLPGPLLMALLADLGLSGSAARSGILRMRHEGLLTSQRAGRQARYQLAPAVYSIEGRLERQLQGQRPAWNGTFAGLLYEVPEAHRAYRDRLRRAALLAGYGILRPGLLIAPKDRSAELSGALDGPPPGAQVLKIRLGLSADDGRRVAAGVWRLDALAQRYRAVIAAANAMSETLAASPPVGREALVAMSNTLQPVYDAASSDPDLPAELLPPDWPGNQIGLVVGSTLRALAPAVGNYLGVLCNDLGVEMDERRHE